MLKGTTLKGLLEAVRPKASAYTAHADYGYVLRHGDEIHIPAAIPRTGGRVLLSDETLLRIRVQSRFAAEDPAAPLEGRPKPVNINRATLEELQELPRIGPETARRIIQERESQGPFRRKEELLRVRGIGRKTYEWLEPLISVE
ncbi:helix-hairpin-helix domain-containing protein [bacterium]|nr:helix-hairpin-helix domain-containing protein [bacterium]